MKTSALKNKALRVSSLLLSAGFALAAHTALANTELWVGISGTSATTNWSDNANWNNVTGGGSPGPNGNDVIFGDGGSINAAGTVNSVVDNNSQNPLSLTFTNNSANGNFHTVLIPNGVAMTNANALTVGIRLSPANSYLTTVGFAGGGTLVQTGAAMQVDNSTTVGGSGVLPTLDLSGLTNFIYTNTAGSITVAGTATGSEARGSGLLNLAGGTNLITVGSINVALGTGNGGLGGTINLGAGTNVINVGTINLAAGKINNATIKFLGPTGGLRLRGVTGADSDRNVTMTLGNRGNSGSGTPTGTLNFVGGYPVDVKANSVTLGRSNQGGAGTGNLSFDTGIIDATTIAMAVTSSTGGANGNLTVSGGTLLVGNLSMVNQTSTGLGVGNLNINAPGILVCTNSILKTTTLGTANITMNGGTLIVSNKIGLATNAIDAVTVADSTLTLNAGLSASMYVTNLSAFGTANTINVLSMPSFFSYPAQFPLIAYTTASGDNNTFVIGTLPGTYQGYISNNALNLTIDVVITNGPAFAPIKAVKWNGAPTGDWTTNTSTLNWLTNGLSVNFNQGDAVTFDDSLTGTASVNLASIVSPASLVVNNSSSNYLFTGTGKISGGTGLFKTGTGVLILDNNSTNDFSGGVIISNGTVQIGNNDTLGNLPAGTSWNNGATLAFKRTDNLTISTVISGTGNLVQGGTGKLTLNAQETYTGNTVITNGTLALSTTAAIPNTPQVLVDKGAFDVSATPPSSYFNSVAVVNNGTFIVDTNNVSAGTLGLTNANIRLVANPANPAIYAPTLITGGATNIINIAGVAGVSPSTPPPVVIPIIAYSTATFNGGFHFGITNFPNAYVTNDTSINAIELVLTATPYVVTWNGAGANDNWSDSNNWSGIAVYPNASLYFGGINRTNPVNDITAGTVYSNIIFNADAGPFTLAGNPITMTGGIFNNSLNPQSINLGVNFAGNVSLNGVAAPLFVGGGLTNTIGASGSASLTLTGTGVLTNILASTASPGGTNALIENDGVGNWTLVDNATSATVTAPWALEINNGVFNFGNASSAPKLISTSAQGVPSDNQVGTGTGVATLNFSNGLFTTSARLNTGGNTASGTINQYGGTINIASQFQGANGSATATSAVNLYGGTMNIGVSPTATNFGTFFVASRGPSSLTITNSALLNCGTLDISRSINSSIPGTVNLNGGTLTVNNVATATANQAAAATGSTATFNFNGGVLKARQNSAAFFQGRTTAPIVPITAIVQTGGAIIDSDTNAITFLEPLLTDPNLGGLPDGGLKKLGTGTLTLAGTNTYIGNTLVGAGTLLINGIQAPSLTIVSNGATLGGNGFIGSNVVVNAGGAVSPGANGVGVLTVAGNVALNGTTTMEINKTTITNDMLVATNATSSTITYSGTLNVPIVSGSATLGDVFKLFSATNYVGAFSAVTPSPGAGLAWNTNNLNVDGTLSVVVGPAGPTTNANITSVTLSGTNLLIHGTNNNVPNSSFRFVVLTSTNLSTPLSNWTPVLTNTFNANGTFDYTNPIVPGTARQFIDVQAVP